ncbi:hypothetical protein BH23VER1_BH23VER1_09650 [soil metagenome]
MLALLLAYHFSPETRDALDRLAALKAEWGYAFSVGVAIMAGSVAPEILRVIVFQGGRPRRQNGANLAFSFIFWGTMGAVVDFFYRCQAAWFGDELTPAVVVPKVLVDQFLYNPFFAAPVTVWCYTWKSRGYRLGRMGDLFTFRFYRDAVMPTLFAAWGVWIPLVTIIYCLPPLLQIPMFGLALTLWVVLLTFLSEQREQRGESGAH